MSSEVPATYRRTVDPSNFNALCGPYYEIIENEEYVGLALHIQEKHLNLQNIGHGGLLMTVADNALGRALNYAYHGKKSLVTVNMNSSFLKPVRAGDWLEARPQVTRTGARMAFADCSLYVKSSLMFSASGVFAILSADA